MFFLLIKINQLKNQKSIILKEKHIKVRLIKELFI